MYYPNNISLIEKLRILRANNNIVYTTSYNYIILLILFIIKYCYSKRFLNEKYFKVGPWQLTPTINNLKYGIYKLQATIWP